MLARLVNNWVYGGFLAGLLLLGVLPELARHWSPELLVVFLQLPIYMLHQYEEHDDDRFRQFVNQWMGGGKEVLSPTAVFAINVPGVWGVDAAAFLLAAFQHHGYGLIAVNLTLVNGIVHIVGAAATRRYNPGLSTAVALFLPAGLCGLWVLRTAPLGYHLLGLLSAIAIHVAIVAYVRGRMRASR